jgi:hypothetical protein
METAYDGRQIVGMDLHRRRSVLVRMTEDGRKLGTARIANSPQELRAQIARAGKSPKVVLEATYGWYWAADTLAAAGAEVHLAHPLGVKAFTYRRVKDDLLTELPNVSADQVGCTPWQPVTGCREDPNRQAVGDLFASPIATETGHTRLNRSATFSSLLLFDASRSRPWVLLQCP